VKAKYVIGSIIIVLFVVWGASAFLKTTVRYVSIEEARHATRVVQVMGKIDFDQVAYNSGAGRLEFAIYDAKAANQETAEHLKVVYYGVVPGNFDQATSVVLKGRSDSGIFVADQMLVKCPSKYQGEGAPEYQDIRKHQQGTGESGA
jgi:cytochrome c-type biogenesis protein CcmE